MQRLTSARPRAGPALPGAATAAAPLRRRRRAQAPHRGVCAAASRRPAGGAGEPTPAPEQAPAPVGAAGSGSAGAAAAAPPPRGHRAERSPFLDPLVRSLFLGVGAGMVCETAHVLLKAMRLAQEGAALPLPFTLGALQQFSPVFITDHAVAIGAWLLLYAVEAGAIMGVLRSNPGKPSQELDDELAAMPLLPRRIFPPSLAAAKDAVADTLAASASAGSGSGAGAGVGPKSAAAGREALAGEAAAPRALAACAPPGLSKQLERALDGVERRAGSGPRRGGAAAGPAAAPAPTPTPAGGAWRQLDRRERELWDRRCFLKNFWYAAALSSNVKKDRPLGVDILGTRIVLFRDERGRVAALDDACPHRGAPLSSGWLTTDAATGNKCVACGYHAWAFDGSGRLRDVPSAERGSWPRRPLLSSYDIVERGGFAWLWYGSREMPPEERPPVPFTPELEDPKWRAVYGEIEFSAGHYAVFQNAIDFSHIHYLHDSSFGNADRPRVMGMQSRRDTFETSCSLRIHNKPSNKLWEWTAVDSVPVTARAMLPSTSSVAIELAHGVRMITFVSTVPISDGRSVNRFCLIRNFATSPAFDWVARDNMYKILSEDREMVDTLRPGRLAAEYSLEPDRPQIDFAALRQEWIDMGYGVPPETELPRRGGLLPEGY